MKHDLRMSMLVLEESKLKATVDLTDTNTCHRSMKNFTIEQEGHAAGSIMMNRRGIQLFQAYATIEIKQHRLNLQFDDKTGDFFIAEKFHCPPVFQKHEKLFSDAMKIHGVKEVVPT